MNEDGSLKNIESRIPSVQILTNPDTDKNKVITINDGGTISQHNEWIVSKTRPTFREEWNQCWYNPDTNKVFFYRSATNNRFMQTAFAISFSVGGDTRITGFTSKNAFHAVDYSDTEYIAHQAMPSTKYIDLTLGSSGTVYTAPADGYVAIRQYFASENSSNFVGIYHYDASIDIMQSRPAQSDVATFMPIKKGQRFRVYYNNITPNVASYFRFVFAEGVLS